MKDIKDMTAGEYIAKYMELLTKDKEGRYRITNEQADIIRSFRAVLKDCDEPLFVRDAEDDIGRRKGRVDYTFIHNVVVDAVGFYEDEEGYCFLVDYRYNTCNEEGWPDNNPLDKDYVEFLYKKEWLDLPVKELFNEFRDEVFRVLRDE